MLNPPLLPGNMDWDTPNNNVDPAVAAIWRERERRQRSVRVLMMFLLMLLLMDPDEPRMNQQNNSSSLRSSSATKASKQQQQRAAALSTRIQLDRTVFQSRQDQDEHIRQITTTHSRYQRLIQKNHHVNMEATILQWAKQQLEEVLDEFPAAENSNGAVVATARVMDANSHAQQPEQKLPYDPEHDKKVWHYPWNSTGFYRGEWNRVSLNVTEDEKKQLLSLQQAANQTMTMKTIDAVRLEQDMLALVQARQTNQPDNTAPPNSNTNAIGVFVLPPGKQIWMRDDNNHTSNQLELVTVDASGRTYPPTKEEAESTTESSILLSQSSKPSPPPPFAVTLTHNHGRVAFQIFSRKVYALKELSLVDGFVKLYDSNTQGYSTRKDILLRVRGVMIHGIGRLSLVGNVPIQRSALVIPNSSNTTTTTTTTTSSLGESHRRLQAAMKDVNKADMVQVRKDAEYLYRHQTAAEKRQARQWMFASPESMDRKLIGVPKAARSERIKRQLKEENESTVGTNATNSVQTILPPWSDIVLPFPFTRDDKDESVRKTKTPAARRMPPREQLLEGNAAGCEFEINMDVQEVEWTIGAWRNLILRRLKEAKKLNPDTANADVEQELSDAAKRSPRSRSTADSSRNRAKLLQDQAVAMTMLGKIESHNCNFAATLNATAIRTDWDATTSKAINYSFYMMLVCLTQILILLRQLIYSQSQSAATKVSVMCVGWQSVIDALMCLAHIYLSLAMQPLFAAFASVAFFKLLIFCVIEMKYMAMIMQARNNSNGGGQSADELRRQVAVLHARFYALLFAAFLLAFYVGEKYRIPYALVLYSFWVPQIILNVITETKKPLHNQYIYGMSLSRLVAPLHIFCLPRNFLKEVYPDSPTDPLMCQLLIVWVGIQVAILLAQGKYGARFMIPARFLPPKFDYSRPLPPSMLPPGAVLLETPTSECIDESHRGSSSRAHDKNDDGDDDNHFIHTNNSSSTLDDPLHHHHHPSARARHTTAVTTRNRIRSNRRTIHNNNGNEGMITETLPDSTSSSALAHHTLDCSICYDVIDIRNPRGYMLAPCDHLFHRDCLVQWMEIKMECPICRTTLPAL